MKKILSAIIIVLMVVCPALAEDVKISELPAVTSTTPATDIVPIVASGVTSKITINNLLSGKLTSANISDTAYDATTWDAVTTIAPSKNVIRDYLESKMPTGTDGTYGLGLNNNTSAFTPTTGDWFTFIADVPYFIIGATQTRIPGLAATISDADTTHAPDGNSVFDALALKGNITSQTFITPNIGAATGTSLVLTGTIQAGVTISSDADGMDAATMSAAGVQGTMFIATGAGTWILPTAVTGMSLCLMDSGTAHDLILDVTAGSTIRLKGTEQADGVGITNAAGTTTGDFVCVLAVAAGKWSTVGMGGAWVSQ